MHPADLVPGLEPVLANRREPPNDEQDTEPDHDALTALTTTSVPLTAKRPILDRRLNFSETGSRMPVSPI
jgi:hypothetical protein